MFCDRCGREFKSKMALCGHLAFCGKNKEIICEKCGKSISRTYLNKHDKWHIDKDSPCLQCGKMTFGGKRFCNRSCSAQYNNIGVSRRKSTSPVICVQCGKIAKRNSSKYCSVECLKRHAVDKYLEKMNSGERITWGTVRKTMLKVFPHICSICGLSEWNKQEIPLVVDHISGNPYDNRVVNLRLICPNCDAQTDTYMGKNVGNGRWERRKRYNSGKSS